MKLANFKQIHQDSEQNPLILDQKMFRTIDLGPENATDHQKCGFVSIYAPARTLNHAHIVPELALDCATTC